MNFICKPFQELSLEELYDTMTLRQAVFVVEQDCPYLDADGKDQVGWHLLGYDENTLVAYARLLPKEISYDAYPSIGRVVTDKEVRGKGYGIRLMEEALRYSEELFGLVPIKISAQQYLIKYYQKFGFEAVGTGYLEDGIPHIAMIRSIKST